MFKCVRDLFKYKNHEVVEGILYIFPSRFYKVNEYNHHNMYNKEFQLK